MKRKEKTELLRNLLRTKLNSKRGVHSAAEVSLDYGTKNVKRVDFVSFEPRDQVSIAGLEAGAFTFYEIKSCREDFKSGFGLNFEGDRNYIVTDMPTYKDLVAHGDIDTSKMFNIGVMVAIPKGVNVLDEFERPNDLTTAIEWELVVVKAAHRKQRKRSMGELLFCMLRSAGNK
jgi:hypothetical protein